MDNSIAHGKKLWDAYSELHDQRGSDTFYMNTFFPNYQQQREEQEVDEKKTKPSENLSRYFGREPSRGYREPRAFVRGKAEKEGQGGNCYWKRILRTNYRPRRKTTHQQQRAF
mmetsp:Transcript_21274/g.55335  ORF Transcript_21274/g.55335 Transcript_21274/m.55335 type:complete len:113 (-) Transcript_21274:1198-1536(-)